MHAIITTCLIHALAAIGPAYFQQAPDAGKPKTDAPAGRGSPRPGVVRMYPIKSANADELASILKRVFPTAQVVADARTNSVLVSAEAESTLNDVQTMIAQLDIAVTDSLAAETRVVAVAHRSGREIIGQLSSTLLSRPEFRDCRIASDDGRNMLVLRGTREFLEQATVVLKMVDVPAESVTLEFAFFQASTRESAEANAAGMPADLADVAKELARFGKIELLGRLSTVAAENEEFKIQGSLGTDLSAEVVGQVLKAKEGGVRLKIDSRLQMSRSVPAGGEKGGKTMQHAGFSTATTISARRGDTVVLGAAPAGWAQGESAILVVRFGK